MENSLRSKHAKGLVGTTDCYAADGQKRLQVIKRRKAYWRRLWRTQETRLPCSHATSGVKRTSTRWFSAAATLWSSGSE